MIRRKGLACLFPVIVFITLRALSHAHPAPLPWTTGVFDADGLDDLLQAIRISYSEARDPHRVSARARAIPTGIVSPSEASPGREACLAVGHCRAPPFPESIPR